MVKRLWRMKNKWQPILDVVELSPDDIVVVFSTRQNRIDRELESRELHEMLAPAKVIVLHSDYKLGVIKRWRTKVVARDPVQDLIKDWRDDA